jgi:acetyl esterase
MSHAEAPAKSPWHHRARRAAGAAVIDGFFTGLGNLSRYQPLARPTFWDVELERDLPYTDSGRPEHVYDLYRPKRTAGSMPVVLYVHGGGFHSLSRKTHWMMGIAFARRGYLVYHVEYRLAPKHRFPAALEDVCLAYEHMVRDAPMRGGDLSRLVVTGESAGANLITALTASLCWERPEPWTRGAFETGVVPKAALPACGLLQTTDSARFADNPKVPAWIADYMALCADIYLGDGARAPSDATLLADPLLIFERGEAPSRPLPAFFAPVGTRDPLVTDTRRLKDAIDALGGHCEARYYKGGLHAFHAFLWEKRARQCWRDMFAFLDAQLAA